MDIDINKRLVGWRKGPSIKSRIDVENPLQVCIFFWCFTPIWQV